MNAPEETNMAQSNSNDSDINDSSDISSQLSEMKENYERKNNELHLEFSQLKDLMMAFIDKTNNESQPSSSQGPSKQPQIGRDPQLFQQAPIESSKLGNLRSSISNKMETQQILQNVG